MATEVQNGQRVEMRAANRPHAHSPEPSMGLSQTARRYAAKAARMGIDNPEDLMDFEAAQKRPLDEHLRRSRIKTYKPVLDDRPWRTFKTTAEYRQWCNDELPAWLGYGTGTG